MTISNNRGFWKGFLSLAVPLALQNLLASSMSAVDTFMVSSQGELAVAAVGVCNQYTQLLFSWFFGFTAVGALFIAQYWGAKDGKGISRAYGMMITLMTVLGVVFSVCSMAFPEVILSIYTNNKEIQEVGVQYLRILGISYIGQMFVFAIGTFLRSTEKIKLPLITSLIAVFANTFLNWVFIFGNLGMPALGVKGAAIATVCSNILNCVILIIACIVKKNPFMWNFKDVFHWDKAFVIEFTRKSIPIMCNEVLFGLGTAMINVVLGRQITEGIAALAVFRAFEGIFFAFFGGILNASTVMIGKEVGAGNLDTAMFYSRRFAWVCPLVSTIVCLVVLPFSGLFQNIFSLSDGAGYYLTMMLIIFTVACPFRMSNYIQNSNYRAGGQAVFGTVLELICLLLFTTPLVFVLGIVVKAPFLWVFGAMYVEELIKICIETKYTLSGKWLNPVTREGQEALILYKESRLKKKAKSIE